MIAPAARRAGGAAVIQPRINRHARVFGTTVVAVIASAVWLGACSGDDEHCSDTRTCHDAAGKGGSGGSSAGGSGEAGDGGSAFDGSASGSGGKGGTGGGGKAGSSGAGGEAGGNGGCDITKSPTEAACLVSDNFALFVAPDGDDAGDGSQDAPFATLTKAVEAAAGEKLVLVCNGTYDEHVTITAASRVYGGFACADWSAEAGQPLFKPMTAGVALRVDTVAAEVLLESVSFEVGDAVLAGGTALTAIVNESPKVTLRSVSLTAGKGKAGADGSLTPFVFKDAAALNGNGETPAGAGGGEKICACQGALMSVGGGGGPPSTSGQSGAKGLPDNGGGQGGDPGAGDCGAGSSGKKGTNATNRDAAPGASTVGAASATGWQPSAGVDGENGAPGQGGGGGASLSSSGHGGGGGCGGCGGTGGTAGKGGGGSIALLALNSPVVLEASALVTADAGSGGNGVAGQPGQKAAGGGGDSINSSNSCDGGTGGFGADGGAGGGAAGGVSAGIVWKGMAAPTVTLDTTITFGKAGAKGAGGIPGTNDGVAGVAEKVLKAP